MGFIKTASAKIYQGHESISLKEWANITGNNTFNARTAGKLIRDFNPDKFLLTHCTIIASVNVDPEVNYYITPDTAKYVNNNGDCWESELLSHPEVYGSFNGAYNYYEHVQIPSLSRGRIISAALRQVPATPRSKEQIYLVDILVATDRKHNSLIERISSGQLNTLSMGCHVKYTTCSKCGHTAEDEQDLCSHVKFAKNSYFYDEKGTKRVIAELCGNKKDQSSVRFIEASWVAVPAFSGAVMRNILSFQDNADGEKAREKVASMIAKAHKVDPEAGLENSRSKAASIKLAGYLTQLKTLANLLKQ